MGSEKETWRKRERAGQTGDAPFTCHPLSTNLTPRPRYRLMHVALSLKCIDNSKLPVRQEKPPRKNKHTAGRAAFHSAHKIHNHCSALFFLCLSRMISRILKRGHAKLTARPNRGCSALAEGIVTLCHLVAGYLFADIPH